VSKRRRQKLTLFQASPGLAAHVEARLTALDSPTTIAIELARAGGIDGLTVSARRSTRASTHEAPEGSWRVSVGACTAKLAGVGRGLEPVRYRRRRALSGSST